jgi:hypothetical protein
MTVAKLETALGDLFTEVRSTRAVHPHLRNAPAFVRAEAEVMRASDCLRRLKRPQPEPGDETLRYVLRDVGRAEDAVRRARELVAMSRRRDPPQDQDVGRQD